MGRYRFVALVLTVLIVPFVCMARERQVSVAVGKMVNLKATPACTVFADLQKLLVLDFHDARQGFEKLVREGRCQRLPDREFRVAAFIAAPLCPSTAQNAHGVHVQIVCVILQNLEDQKAGYLSTFIEVVRYPERET